MIKVRVVVLSVKITILVLGGLDLAFEVKFED
jgi:hypothetical protein